MDLKNIINEIAQKDPEFFEKTSDRRHVLQSFGSKVAIAAIPFALGSFFKKAYGKTTDAVLDTLNFALKLEYLEANFYMQGNAAAAILIPGADQSSFQTIGSHENEHVTFLKTAITSAGGTPVSPAAVYTFQAVFPDVFTNYATFLAVSQTLEDTGVRAYKGGAGALQANHDVLTAALQIHSVEARHASHVRYIRRKAGVADNPKPWITGNTAPVSSVAANYAGEDNVIQGGVTITSLPGVSGNISMTAATEAFDEPLDSATVLQLVAPFGVS